MSTSLLCPLKFNNPRPANIVDWGCEKNKCAWWDRGKERCVIIALTMTLWAIQEKSKNLNSKEVEECTENGQIG